MKRLTKDERIGATAIALVALLICGGSILWSSRDRSSKESEEAIRSIILASDSISSGTDSDKEELSSETAYKKSKKRKGDKNRKDKKTGKKKRKQKEAEKPKKTAPSRDHLNDPI